jgi:DNA replication protein DnaC
MKTEHILEALKPDPPQSRPSPELIAAACKRYGWERYHAKLSPVMPAALAFRRAFLADEAPPRWLTLLGPSGTGKTHLIKAMFAELRHAMRGGHGIEAAHIIPAQDLQDYAAPRHYARYGLLYIEDIGAGSDDRAGSGAVLRSRLVELLQLRSRRWTMLDGNLSVGDVSTRLDQRIASRLRRDGSWLVQIPDSVPDYWWRQDLVVDGENPRE